MDKDGKLRLELLNAHGKFLSEGVEVNLRHQVLSHNAVLSVNAARQVTIRGLFGAPQGLYRIEVDPPSYLPISQFINLHASEVTDLQITFPIDPKKVKKVNFTAYEDVPAELQTLLENSTEVLGFGGLKGRQLYKAIDNVRKAALLNIVVKTAATPLTNGKTVLPYITRLNELRGDRFFAFVQKELREETKNSVAEGLFRSADDTLHHLPEQFSGFNKAGSYKTEDAYGNLQLTFFMKGDECVADIDIDDAAGLGHVFQVLRNALTNRATHPYDIHEILLFHQKLDPLYTFEV